jgi:lipid-A-disaccharide synthase-like uncharacterized protein
MKLSFHEQFLRLVVLGVGLCIAMPMFSPDFGADWEVFSPNGAPISLVFRYLLIAGAIRLAMRWTSPRACRDLPTILSLALIVGGLAIVIYAIFDLDSVGLLKASMPARFFTDYAHLVWCTAAAGWAMQLWANRRARIFASEDSSLATLPPFGRLHARDIVAIALAILIPAMCWGLMLLSQLADCRHTLGGLPYHLHDSYALGFMVPWVFVAVAIALARNARLSCWLPWIAILSAAVTGGILIYPATGDRPDPVEFWIWVAFVAAWHAGIPAWGMRLWARRRAEKLSPVQAPAIEAPDE